MRSDALGPETAGAASTIMPRPDILKAGGIGKLDMMDATIDAIDNETDPFSHLVAGKAFADHPACDRLRKLGAMDGVLVHAAPRSEAVIGQRPVHGLDDVVALAEFLQARLGPVGESPASGFVLRGKTVTLQPLHPVDQQMAVLPNQKALPFAGSEVDDAMILSLFDQDPVEPGQPFRIDLTCQLAGDVQFGLRTEFERHQFTCPMADTMRNVVACDIQDLAIVGDTPDQDVGMGVAGIVVIDRYPIQIRPEIGFHLLHEARVKARKSPISVASSGATMKRN